METTNILSTEEISKLCFSERFVLQRLREQLLNEFNGKPVPYEYAKVYTFCFGPWRMSKLFESVSTEALLIFLDSLVVKGFLNLFYDMDSFPVYIPNTATVICADGTIRAVEEKDLR